MKKIKFFCFLISIMILMSACGSMKNDQQETDIMGEDESQQAELISLLDSNGASRYKIVCSYKADSEETIAVSNLNSKLKSLCGVSFSVSDDYNEDDPFSQQPIATDSLEILVGRVNRVESAALYETLTTEYDWAVQVTENKIVLASLGSLDRAVEGFLSMIETGNGQLQIPSNGEKIYLLSESELIKKLHEDYIIIYPNGAAERVQNAAHTISEKMAVLESGYIKTGNDGRAERSCEILVGETNREASRACEALGYFDYDILFRDSKILVRAGCSLVLETAVEKLTEMLLYNDLRDVKYRFDLSLLSPYITDPDRFVPVWSGTHTVEEWMTDFDEKLYALTDPDERMLSMSHRADLANYPENSLESILSAIMLGADILELDVQITKDNVLVLMHDTTLVRTTNVNQMKGKNGLPNSTTLSDWTFEQLRQLSLKDIDGKLTDYKIPTFYEAVAVSKGRCFINVDQKSTRFNIEDEREVQEALQAFEPSVSDMFYYSGASPENSSAWKYLQDYSEKHPELEELSVLVEKMSGYLEKNASQRLKSGWAAGYITADPTQESYAKYKELYETGTVDLIFVNDIQLMCKYIQENYLPANVSKVG